MYKLKSYKILWWTIPIIFLLFALDGNSVLNLQWHDTYFVLSALHVALILSLIPGILGVIYWKLKSSNLNTKLSLIHSIGTSLSVVGIALIFLFLELFHITGNFELFKILNSLHAILFLIFLSLQLMFIANVIIGLSQGKK